MLNIETKKKQKRLINNYSNSIPNNRYATKHFKALCNRQTKCQEYFCEKCGHIFSELEALLEHAENGHKKGKSYALVSDIATRPYLCEVCGKGYTQSSHLYQHLRFHKGIKPFECSFDNCSRRFTIRPDLNDHIRKCHTGERVSNNVYKHSFQISNEAFTFF